MKVLVPNTPNGKPIPTAINVPIIDIWMVSRKGRNIMERKFQESSGGNMPVKNFQR